MTPRTDRYAMIEADVTRTRAAATHRGRARRALPALLVAALLAGLVVVPGGAAGAAPRRCSSTPFRSDARHHHWFRIPAIVQTKRGTLVAFAERRDRLAGDLGNFEIVTTRSVDGGCHWSRYRVIGDDGRNRVASPVPLVDRTTGHVLLFSVVTPRSAATASHKGLFLQTSSDDGRTFTSLRGNRLPVGYLGGLTGPGHGIQLTVTHPGRLIIPLGYRTTKGVYGAYGAYSDDHGRTWRTGYQQRSLSRRVDLIEGTIAELPSGKLFISYRDKTAKRGTPARRYAISADGGATLSQKFRPQKLRTTSVQGSSLVPRGSHARLLLFSAPASPKARRDLSVFVSTTGGATWGRRYQVRLSSSPGAYSDLVQTGPDSIGVLYETGRSVWREQIAFQAISISALLRQRR